MATAIYSDLKDKIVLITGASSGIGAATAKYFASQHSKNVVALEQVKAECEKLGSGEVIIVTCDLSKGDEVCEDSVLTTVTQLGGLDILVNNAGYLARSGFSEVTSEDIDTSMEVNLKSAVRLSQVSLPYLVERKGNIVNVSSIAGLRAYPGALAYKMSKAAMDQMTRCVALEVAGSGVRVNSVNPGVIVTDIFNRSGMSEDEIEAYMEQSKLLHPLGRAGYPDEVASAIVFLASGAASFITGQTLAIDGGRSVSLPYTNYK